MLSHTLALKSNVWSAPYDRAFGNKQTTAAPIGGPESAARTFPVPANEPQRLAALRALQILDTTPENAYDEIAELAAQICGCPVAFISFIDDDRRWLKAKYGLPLQISEAPRQVAVCTTTICGTDVFVVPDMRQDPRFAGSPIVIGDPHCRFYCGMPLITNEGHALGTLCVMDFAPRQLSFEQTESLRRLSRQVLTQLELRRKLIEYDQTIQELDQARIEAAAEKARAEELLENVLPSPIADELKKNGSVQPKYIHSATILFADFQGFTLLAERTEPAALLALLDCYFRAFDDIIARHGLEKLKTIGDAYMAVGGVPASDRRHPIDACLAALEMQATVAGIKSRNEKMGLPAMELRVGIHTGPVISGIVGSRRFAFDIWGDAVNTASFMEAHCLPGRINISESVAGHVKALFELESRGSIKAKHKRPYEMFFLNRLKSQFLRDLDGRALNQNFEIDCNNPHLAPCAKRSNGALVQGATSTVITTLRRTVPCDANGPYGDVKKTKKTKNFEEKAHVAENPGSV
jgi:class 3 adenylate cyclase